MKLPRVRITVQLMMVLIAVGTVLIVGPIELARTFERGTRYGESSSTHASQQHLHERAAAECERRVGWIRELVADGETTVPGWATQFAILRGAQPTEPKAATRFYEREAARFRRWARHEAALNAKYKRAAKFPFVAVEPDPPLPE